MLHGLHIKNMAEYKHDDQCGFILVLTDPAFLLEPKLIFTCDASQKITLNFLKQYFEKIRKADCFKTFSQ